MATQSMTFFSPPISWLEPTSSGFSGCLGVSIDDNDRSRARQLVVVGYCIVAIGYFIQFVDYFSKVGLHNLPGYELLLYYLCTPLAYGITGWSWYWLSRETSSEGYNTMSRRRCLRGLALRRHFDWNSRHYD
jgi:hypothetical protein